MTVAQKELFEAIKNLLDPFLYATKCEKGGDILLDAVTYNIPTAMLEIAKALNRIADGIGKTGVKNG